MSITVKVTQEEILNTPNDFVLGELVRNKYWKERRNQEGPPVDDEHFFLDIAEDGTVNKIIRPWECTICGESTKEVEYDYLAGYDHLACVLKQELKLNPDSYDKCVICGKETPYLVSTHIDHRIGYVEGGGQGCYQPNICDRV